jgi:Holliday junction DNA helicase RuvB
MNSGRDPSPEVLSEFVGQARVREKLNIFVSAARMRGEPLAHVLLTGPPGTGKTTLGRIIARELGAGIRTTSATTIAGASDLAKILTNLQPRDVLFIDEIHSLPRVVEEMLCSAMENFRLDVMIGEGPMARILKVDLAPFTLVGATTRSKAVSEQLQERFGITLRLDLYDVESLNRLVQRSASARGIQVSPEAAREIAANGGGTPRLASQLLTRSGDRSANILVCVPSIITMIVTMLGGPALERNVVLAEFARQPGRKFSGPPRTLANGIP